MKKASACLVHRLVFGCLLMGCVVLGCRAPGPGAALSPDDPRPDALVQALRTRAASHQTMRGTARLSLDAEDLRFRRPQRMAVKRPAHLRVEILGLFGQLAAVLVTDGEVYQYFDVRSGEGSEGAVTSDLLWRLARVDLAPAEVVELLLGAPLPGPGLVRAGAVESREGAVAILFEDTARRARQRFEFDALGRLLRLESFDEAGTLSWEARFEDYREVEGTPFAHDVQLRFPRVSARASLSFKRVQLGPELSDELFVLTLPERSAQREQGAQHPAQRRAL
ncbi:MAG: DUF4292 domain-containing protein [Deltaproteobacteria bacterium]|nr:DUF4292 domain-containing protein [Deltaproteobacteria bacterium]